MRYFTLKNADGVELDITTQQVLFHDIGGIGFSEETDFRRVGDVWRLNSVAKEQTPVTGKMLFSEFGGTTPYEKYLSFKSFIDRAPLILTYYPMGVPSPTEYIFYKRVRVTKLEKTEITQLGVLDCPIDFTPYTPWYQIANDENQADSGDGGSEEDTGWIWGKQEGGVYTTPPLVFEPTPSQNATRAKFRAEPRLYTEIVSATSGANPVKLTIVGPAVNPVWTHYLDGVVVETGGFADNFTLNENEELIIDSTEGDYLMYVRHKYTNAIRNVYSLRNFDTVCFFSMKEGANRITATSSDGVPVKIKIEGHIYYATV